MSLWITRDKGGGYSGEVVLWQCKPVFDREDEMWLSDPADNGSHIMSFRNKDFKKLTNLKIKRGECRRVTITPTASKQGFIFHLEE